MAAGNPMMFFHTIHRKTFYDTVVSHSIQERTIAMTKKHHQRGREEQRNSNNIVTSHSMENKQNVMGVLKRECREE